MEKNYTILPPEGSGNYVLLVSRPSVMMAPSYAAFFVDYVTHTTESVKGFTEGLTDGVLVTMFPSNTPYILFPKDQLLIQTNAEVAEEHKAEEALIRGIFKDKDEKEGGLKAPGQYV